jgi:hypothetical protein
MQKRFLGRFFGVVKERGLWQGLTDLGQGLADTARRFYANKILHVGWLTRLFKPFKAPCILMVSYPRSGSTWISSILGFSPDLAYLFEPVTTAFVEKVSTKNFYLPDGQDPDFDLYAEISDQAFHGIPPRTSLFPVIKSYKDFWLPNRKNLRLLIKEINPPATAFFIGRYTPDIIVLLRHPAAVAESHERMGYLSSIMDFEFFGLQYGEMLAAAIEASKNSNPIIIHYEDFAKNPEIEFKHLFSQLNVREPADFDGILAEFCNSGLKTTNPHQIKRVSSMEAYKWRGRFSAEHLAAVKRGYFRSPLQYYRDDSWLIG